MPLLLIVDDEPRILESLGAALAREGHQIETAPDLQRARGLLAEAFDAVLLDVALPDGNGLELLKEIRTAAPETVVVMMSGQATIDVAVDATREGAYDFLEKPVSLERLIILLRNAFAGQLLRSENRRLADAWAVPIVGESRAVRALLGEIARAGPSPARVLILGEHGTGKELVARALHAASPRAGNPFVAVNCAAIPEELLESELFGHEKGAFTGALHARRGVFEEAQEGTLFLDEVGDLSARAQTKLLRVMQEGELTRVGGSRTIRVDVRVIAATNRDLEAAVRAEAFREDLYFRLAVVPITVPPLRERRSDIPALVAHFSRRVAADVGRKAPSFDREAMVLLEQYGYPGNVRELRNIVERLIIMHPADRISATAVSTVLPGTPPALAHSSLADAVRAFERAQIDDALRAEDGHMTRAAERLGLERSHLYKKMKSLGMKAGS